MLKAFKYRIYPNVEQTELLNKHFGSVRFLYNLALETKINAYRTYGKSISCHDLIKQIPDLKKECSWLKEVGSLSLQSAIRNLDTAFQSFFKGNGFPNFKKKNTKQSFQIPQSVEVDFKEGFLHLPKFNTGIKAVYHRKFKGEIRTVTISKTPTGKFFASILVKNNEEIPIKKPISKQTAVGIDLGIKTFATFFTLNKTDKKDNPKHLLQSIAKLKFQQRRLSKKKKRSFRYKVWKQRVAKLHEKIANQRRDFLHQLSAVITKQYDTICMETLMVTNMIKNHKLARSIADCGWNMFEGFLRYKCEWLGKNFLQTPAFEPTSKKCSCGRINQALTLADRIWTCLCGLTHDRDILAARNVLFAALKYAGVERSVEDVEVSTVVEPVKRQKFFSGLSA